MEKFVITGGNVLSGSIEVAGAKNAALKALAASLLFNSSKGPVTIDNVPQIEDVHRLVEIMKDIGLEIEQDGSSYIIKDTTIKKNILEPHLHQRVRVSVLLVGPMLLQTNKVSFPHPGGCVIGERPIDYFLEGFKSFGIDVEEDSSGYSLTVDKWRPAKIIFPRISVTGTEAMMMLASRIPGTSKIVNAAMEPEISALADFLNSCGAKISGAGTPNITIEGVSELQAGTFITPPDRIEAGTFAVMAAATKSHLKITNCDPTHLEVLWKLFDQAGIKYELGQNTIEVFPSDKIKAITKDIITHEYPGLPTDLQAPMAVLMTQAQGNSLVHETVYEARLFYIDKLNSMGADILMCDPHRVLISGPTKLYGKKISSPDIRAGIALVIAALIAEGETELDNIYQIDRGYEKIEQRLQALGANIQRIKD